MMKSNACTVSDMLGLLGTLVVPNVRRRYDRILLGHWSPSRRLSTDAFSRFGEIERYREPHSCDELECISMIGSNRISRRIITS